MKKIVIALFSVALCLLNLVACSKNKKIEKDVCNMGYYFNHSEEIEESDNQNSDMAIDKVELTRKITDELNEEIGVPTIFINPNVRRFL